MDGKHFFARLVHLKCFKMMCVCEKCMADSRENFALRCTNCNGPVPWDEEHFPDNILCLICERPNHQYSNLKVRKIAQEYRTIRNILWLIGNAITKQQLYWLEARMSKLSTLIHLNCREFIGMIRSLCAEYIRRRMYKLAIGWYQWLADGKEIDICSDNDPLVRIHNLDQWATVYISYLEGRFKKRKNMIIKKSSSLPFLYFSNQINAAEAIFKRLFAVYELLNMKQCDRLRDNVDYGDYEDEKCMNTTNSLNSIDYDRLMKWAFRETENKFVRFQELCSKIKLQTAKSLNVATYDSGCGGYDDFNSKPTSNNDLVIEGNFAPARQESNEDGDQ